MSTLEKVLDEKLQKRKAAGLLRALIPAADRVDFFSNDYLGLSRSPELREMIHQMYQSFPPSNGSTGSRLLSGDTKHHHLVEEKLAGIFAGPALLFNSGYNANLAVLSSLPVKGDTILYDELAHASIKDGARLSVASRFSFRHNDPDDLERKLKKSTGQKFVAVESLYSMDGDFTPLREVIGLSKKYDATIILDEAHSTGIFGKYGEGFAIEKGFHTDVAIRIHTFGKAMGCHGAVVVASNSIKNFLINFSRPFIYTTAPDLHLLTTISCAFDFLRSHPELRTTLDNNIRDFTQMTQGRAAETAGPIQTVMIAGNLQARQAASKLQQAGFEVRAILSPTVPAGKERLRICLHAFNTREELKSLSLHMAGLFN